MAKGVTPRSEDYSRWYTDVVLKAELADYTPVRGAMAIRPYGYAIWEAIRDEFDRRFKATGHVNAYFPLFIPKSFLSKEAEHIAGFAKECAVVTHTRLMSDPDGGGVIVDPDSKLEEELIVRPTSETIIWHMYKQWINSYRDLPILINQWANVVRWELRTRLFLRTSEFLWQEGHTAHATQAEAVEETLKMLEVYREVAEDVLALPVFYGRKSESEKFAGAVDTYAIEAIMGDGKALQSGTTHFLGQNFAKAFDVTFRNQANEIEHVWATSWGVSTRLIGAIIMAHGDDQGLRLPPRIAPYQVVIVPIYRDDTREQVLAAAEDLEKNLTAAQVRVHLDNRETLSPGFKFNDWEMKGAPVRIEIGPRDVAAGQAVYVRRDKPGKESASLGDFASLIPALLDEIQASLYQQAVEHRDSITLTPESWEQFQALIADGKVLRCGWDGTAETEAAIKDATKATIRVIPLDGTAEGLTDIYSGKPARHAVIYAKAY